jgi:hypothetical protein
MKDWQPLPPDEELERADDLLDQADALLGRHRASRAADAPDAAPLPSLEDGFDDDLPILTEVVDESELPPGWSEQDSAPLPPAPVAASSPAPPQDASPPVESTITPEDRIAYLIAERLIELDTRIACSINDWMDNEFPQLLQRELDQLGERLRAEVQAHMRATLLPELSAQISRQMEAIPDGTPPLLRR